MSTPQLPDARVRAAVSRADRQRRSRQATQALARLTPIAAGAALAARLAGWPMLVPILALSGSAVGLVIYSIYRRRTREISDPIALAIDSEANLGGELRSAHWFATNSGGDEWSASHQRFLGVI